MQCVFICECNAYLYVINTYIWVDHLAISSLVSQRSLSPRVWNWDSHITGVYEKKIIYIRRRPLSRHLETHHYL
jgi:hypothetical protein